ncbi:hypothetical protein J8I87_38345 [Paraburkholderia sp. LEh10]|uniref:hypothetical protein n=1 Tax=Paraburkholderia sp. LEh10 TaxID=2821353 RepID=UPI001AE8D06D|nr:hypothetical protein [Paraburkholderia sp. LEh10]MBP0595409.1 hypothetical protein [Paraburkholderia sp. LEh10]
MRQTVLGVFDSYADACSSQRALVEAGVAQADIAIYSTAVDALVEKGPRVYAAGGGDVRHHKRVFDQLEQLFARLFKRGEYPPETEDYREFIRRGGALVSADVSEMEVDLACDVMRRAGAADIDERSNAWRNDAAERDMSGRTSGRDSATAREPVTALQDDMTLHSERETAPSLSTSDAGAVPSDDSRVSAPSWSTSTGDASAGVQTGSEDRSRSSAEPRMVSGMQQVTTRTEGSASTPHIQSRQSMSSVPDVRVARTSEGVDAGLKSRAARSPQGSITEKAEHTYETGRFRDPVKGAMLDDGPLDDEFRKDYDAHYANTGASYDEYRRAYTHGATLGEDERYRGYDWQGVEPSARENWESRYPESGWERFKAAVRHGWERVTRG